MINNVNKVHGDYINQYQMTELNSTMQKTDNKDDALAKKVYERADVKDSVEISSRENNNSYAKTVKGLSDEQVNTLKDQMKAVEMDMLRKMVESVHESMQSKLGSIFTKDNPSVMTSTGAVLTAEDFAVPGLPQTQEEAQAAIAEGGVWSVDATATRIVDLSVKIANGDLGMLEVMRQSFLDGYGEAASLWNGATGDDLPGICKDTYDEVLKRFDEVKAEWTAAQEEAEQV